MNFLQRLLGGRPKAPVATPQEVEAIMAQYNALVRPASLAQVGGVRPPDDPLASWFGGHGVLLPAEAVPRYDGKPMFPLLQVQCAALPYVPPALADTALFVVWYNQQLELPFEQPNGAGWLLREYASLEGLAPVTGVAKPKWLQTFPISWSRSDTEAPNWEEVIARLDFGRLDRDQLDDALVEELFATYTNYEYTKIGGYPSLIQGSIDHADTFVFQIGSEEKARWHWEDAGTAYFSKGAEGAWEFECQFY